MSRLARFFRNFGSRDAEVLEDLRVASRVPGATEVSRVRPREMSCVAGIISSVTPSAGTDTPRLTISVTDGTGEVSAQFLGRREISGIKPGALVLLQARFCAREGRLVGYNPVYELIHTKDDHE